MTDNELQESLKELARALDQKKAEHTVVLNLQKVSSYLNYFVIAGALSNLHARNLANETIDFMKERGIRLAYHDTMNPGSGWITLDFGSFIVHILSEDKRSYYDLEDYWNNAERIEW